MGRIKINKDVGAWDGTNKVYPKGEYRFKVASIREIANNDNSAALEVSYEFQNGQDTDGSDLAGKELKQRYQPDHENVAVQGRLLAFAEACQVSDPHDWDIDEVVGAEIMAIVDHYVDKERDKTYNNVIREQAVESQPDRKKKTK